MKKAALRQIPVEAVTGRTAVVRADFNVPLQGGQITDDRRIRATLPTLTYLKDGGGRAVLLSHLGRPKGRPVPELSLRPIADRLARLWGDPVQFVPALTGDEVPRAVADLPPEGLLLLENLRFHPGEEENDPGLAEALAGLGDIYVNDAFGACHRSHASVVGLAGHLRPAVAGLLVEREVEVLTGLMDTRERPFIALLGGAKVGDKVGLFRRLLERADHILVGGAMACTFYRARGWEVGESLVDEGALQEAEGILEGAGGDRLHLPTDVVIAEEIRDGAPSKVVEAAAIPSGWRVVDIGPRTIQEFGSALSGAQTIFWNGPLGVFEVPRFSGGTEALARAVAEATARKARTVVGGGDSAAAVARFGLEGRFTHVSTGGGAALELLGRGTLPGVEALSDPEEVDRWLAKQKA